MICVSHIGAHVSLMDVHYLEQNIIEIPGRLFDLTSVERRELGEAILDAPDRSVTKSQGVGVLGTVKVRRGSGRVWLEALDGTFFELSPKVVAHAPEVLGALVLHLLGVPPERTSNEYLIFVSFNGRPVALLRDPQWEEMFWTSFEVVPFAEFPQFDGPWWRQDDQLEYVQATTSEILPTFGHFDEETSHIMLRGEVGGGRFGGLSTHDQGVVRRLRVRRNAMALVVALLTLVAFAFALYHWS